MPIVNESKEVHESMHEKRRYEKTISVIQVLYFISGMVKNVCDLLQWFA